MPYIHVVAFSYADSITSKQQTEILDRLAALKDGCVDAEGKSYIQDFKLGRANISPEGMGKGFEHLFVVTFADAAKVKYYLEEDPFHLAFAAWVKPLLADAFIYDFEV